MTPHRPRRRRRYSIGILTALLACWIPAQAADRIEKPFLWRIKATPDAKPSYLFGTIHLSRPEVTDLPTRVQTAMHAVDAIYTEIPMDPATLVQMTPRMFLPQGQTLSELMPEDLREQSVAAVRTINPELTLAAFDRMKIWAFAAGLVMLEDQFKHPGILAQDMVIFQRGALDGKDVGGLETVDEQLAIFEDLTTDQQLEMLRDTLRQIAELRAKGESPSQVLVDLYLAGDIDALGAEMDRYFDSESELSAQLMERLLTRRNRLMAERILEKLRADNPKTYFFAVGAAHCYGETGIPDLLRATGVEVIRIGGD